MDVPDRLNTHRVTPSLDSAHSTQEAADARRWAIQLAGLRRTSEESSLPKAPVAPEKVLYVIDVFEALSSGKLMLKVVTQQKKKDGSWGKAKHLRPTRNLVSKLEESDQQIVSMLAGGQEYSYGYTPYSSGNFGFLTASAFPVPSAIAALVTPLICMTGRCHLLLSRAAGDELQPVRWDDGPAWEFWLEASLGDAKSYVVSGRLQRGSDRMGLDEPALLLGNGFVFGKDGVVSRLKHSGGFGWISLLRNQGDLSVPVGQSDDFLAQLLALGDLPPLDLPDSLKFEQVVGVPRPRVQIYATQDWGQRRLKGRLSFDYAGAVIAAADGVKGYFRTTSRQFVLRDSELEDASAQKLLACGFRSNDAGEFGMLASKLPSAVRELIGAGWHVEAEGQVYRVAGAWRMEVRSGIDWFELEGGVEFGPATARLPDLLAAIARKDSFVTLDDGTVGMLPEEWLDRFGLLSKTATSKGDVLRFKRTQVGILDALLAAQPDATVDKAFEAARLKLMEFEGVAPQDPPNGFVGELRDYQREGLGWLKFLQEFGFGGCLADDMGLGKTVQVLALLESRRNPDGSRNGSLRKEERKPSLVVVPRSLIFNWRREAENFTPKLTILDHSSATRLPPGRHFNDYDLILTTYGIIRREAAEFAEQLFDYAILDEAQAIKNANTAAAKAVRLLKADHRLALSGTPIENHLGELWSLIEFLNPGMLGSASSFRQLADGQRGSAGSGRELLARALKPFILRRTKEQVAKDLPPKTEQTIFCELQGTQRKHYEQVRDHYRRNLLRRVDDEGIKKSKIQVLEALLRLRQIACHPGLVDPAKILESSAKFDLLVPQLLEVVEEGHKALVFSQFTKLLGILRERLDLEGVNYEYLDGHTRDRQRRVDAFQSNPDCGLFLISLKAGGLGLNLTAAEYVFLLDPWWNPAVEAQAIDRAHRIGQARPVFAYRIIAKDTVEEKVLQLQSTKRELADAILNSDKSLIRGIEREDLELLLS